MALVDHGPAGPVYWIDHFVVCTNQVERWEAFHRSEWTRTRALAR